MSKMFHYFFKYFKYLVKSGYFFSFLRFIVPTDRNSGESTKKGGFSRSRLKRYWIISGF